MPDISRALKILWFILLFFQQVILCKAFLRIRSGIIKLWTMIVFAALAICAVPLGVVYYTSEKTLTLKNVFTVWLMEKYPDDPKKVFSIMGIWLLVLIIVFAVYMLTFKNDALVRKAHKKAFILFFLSAVISFVSIHNTIILIPLAAIAVALYVVGVVLLIIFAGITIFMLVNMVPILKSIPKTIFDMMSDTAKDVYSGSKRDKREKGPRQIEKLRSQNESYYRNIDDNYEGLRNDRGDSKAQHAAIDRNSRNIAINNAAIDEIQKELDEI